MRRIASVLLALSLVAGTAGSANASETGKLRVRLAGYLRESGPASGAHVLDVGRNRVLLSVRADKRG